MAVAGYGVLCFLPLLLVSGYGAPNTSSDFNGQWELVSENSGVSAMHAILLPKVDKVLMYDATVWKISRIPLPPEKMPCRVADPVTGELDCWCHSVLFDYKTAQLTALKIQHDTWCSSGGLTAEGDLVSTGGNEAGANTTRYLSACDNCDWREYPSSLANPRWYSTQVTLADGGFMVVGGRGAFTYEYIPPEGQTNNNSIFLPLLQETSNQLDGLPGQPPFLLENNLYPFVHLSPDGNLFIFSNNRSILFNPKTNQVVREFPVLPGGSRNYPASAMSVLLPLRLKLVKWRNVSAEVLVCGGAPWDSFYFAQTQQRFLPALQDCGRIKITEPDSVWTIEQMSSPRVMGDMIILPNADVLMLNGAKAGTSAWNDADDPNLAPVLYMTREPMGQRFKELLATTIPRMYHSSSTMLPDGKVLVAGSNTNDGYIYDAKYPTELRVEKFSPPYLDPSLSWLRQEIVVDLSDKLISYGKTFSAKIKSNQTQLLRDEIKVTMYAPGFTTHGLSMNQRLLILVLVDMTSDALNPGIYNIIAGAPLSGEVAPPGYYLLSVVYKGVPSASMWVQIK